MTASKPKVSRPAQSRAARAASSTLDGYQNLAANVGVGTGNLSDFGTYGLHPITRERILLEFAYRGSWLCGVAIDIPAEDMTVEGVTFLGTESPEQIDDVNAEADNTEFWAGIESWLKWSRLYGGAIAVMLIDGQDPSTPLNIDTIRKGQFKGFRVFERWLLNPSYPALGLNIGELGPHMTEPAYYEPVADAPLYSGVKIHWTRCLRGIGVPLPYYQSVAENGWGLSVLERLYDRLLAFDSGTSGAGQLLFKAYLRTIKINGLHAIIAAGGQAQAALEKRLEFIRMFARNEGITLLDANDAVETTSYSFAGLSDVLTQFGQQVSGALQIPLVRLFGQSPAGLNATGEADLRTYYDGIARLQRSRLKNPLHRALQVLWRSATGAAPPASWSFKFNPLWQVSNAEKAEIASKDTATIVGGFDSGMISEQTALKELRQLSAISGRWTNITDAEIEASDDKPPDPSEALLGAPEGMAGEEQKPLGGPKGSMRIKPDSSEGKKDVIDSATLAEIEKLAKGPDGVDPLGDPGSGWYRPKFIDPRRPRQPVFQPREELEEE